VYDDSRAARVVAVTAAKRAARGGALWGLVFGVLIAASESTYVKTFPTLASRRLMARSFTGNAGFAALFGPIHNLDSVAGYTAYKVGYTIIVLGSIWGLLVATRLLRGEEDAGRWELFLAGRTNGARALLQTVAGLGAGVASVWYVTVIFAVASGRGAKVGIGPSRSLFFVTALVSATAMFVAAGVLASQLAATRHDANLIGAGAIAGSYLVRMVADSDAALGWLRWASPFGWIEELRPLAGSKPLGFVPIVGFAAACVGTAVVIARRRDLSGSVFASRDAARPHTLLLGGQAGLTIRLTRATFVAWTAVLATVGLVFGLVTQAAGRALGAVTALNKVMGRMGATRAGAVVYLGLVFTIAAALVAIAVAGQISAMRNEESNGYLDNLVVRSVPRWRWLAVRAAVGAGLVAVSSLLAGVAAWIGAATQHAGLGIGELVRAGVNVAPPAALVLGVGVLVYGLWPRRAVAVTYGLVVWSFTVDTVALLFGSNHWLRDTSPLTHMSPAPAADPNWTSALWLAGIGLLACVAGIAAFTRRDLQGA
jgi:ABC-2 type transport system permease protein